MMNIADCGSHTSSEALSYLTASISAVLSLITIPGNMLICLAVYLDPYRRLRTPFNIVVANLAFADLIVGCITEPLSVYLHVKEGLGREIRILEIRVLHLSYFISCTASVLSISLLALERYMSISYSFKYRRYFKVRRFVLVSLLVWLVAIGLSVVYLLTSYVFYTFVFINIAVFWTLGVTTFCYVKILRKLKKVEKARVKESTVISNENAIENSSPALKTIGIINENISSSSMASEGVQDNEPNVKNGNIINPIKKISNEKVSSVVVINGIINENISGSSMASEGFESNEPSAKDRMNPTQKISNEIVSPVVVINGIINETGYVSSSSMTNEGFESIEPNVRNVSAIPTQNIVENSRYPELGTSHNSRKASGETTVVGNECTSNKYNILVTKTYLVVSVVFLACYIPALIIIYTMNWCTTCSCSAIHIMRDLQFIVVIVNSSVNPFLYAIRFSHFRRAILKILQVMRDEVFY